MSTMPDASVIIPTYNRAQFLEFTLSSLVEQRTDYAFEVIVVDDGSTDSPKAIVDRFNERLNLRFISQCRDGYRLAEARNKGILAAKADWCIFTDPGVLASSTFIQGHLEIHLANRTKRCAVVGYSYGFRGRADDDTGCGQFIDPHDVPSTIERLRQMPRWWDIRDSKFYSIYGEDLSVQPAPWVAFWGLNMSASREAIMEVGMFDPNYREWGFEDIDLGYRLYVNRNTFVLSRKAVVVHIPHGKDDGASAMRNKEYFNSKFRNTFSSFANGNPYDLRVNGMILEKMYPFAFSRSRLEQADW